MAKSKNTSHHHQNRKDHRNGIKRPTKQRFMSMKGVDQKFLRNLRFAKKGNKKIVDSVTAKRIRADNGATEYFVKWRGFDQCTWEPARNLSDTEALRKFDMEMRVEELRKSFKRGAAYKVQQDFEISKIIALDKKEKSPGQILLLVEYAIDASVELVPIDIVCEKYPTLVNKFLCQCLPGCATYEIHEIKENKLKEEDKSNTVMFKTEEEEDEPKAAESTGEKESSGVEVIECLVFFECVGSTSVFSIDQQPIGRAPEATMPRRKEYDPLEGIPTDEALQNKTVEEDMEDPQSSVEDHEDSEELSDLSEEEETPHWTSATTFSFYTFYARVRPLMKSRRVRVLTVLNSFCVAINILLLFAVLTLFGIAVYHKATYDQWNSEDMPCIYEWAPWSKCNAECTLSSRENTKQATKIRRINMNTVVQARGKQPFTTDLAARIDRVPCNTHLCPKKLSEFKLWTGCFYKNPLVGKEGGCYHMRQLPMEDTLIEVDTTTFVEDCPDTQCPDSMDGNRTILNGHRKPFHWNRKRRQDDFQKDCSSKRPRTEAPRGNRSERRNWHQRERELKRRENRERFSIPRRERSFTGGSCASTASKKSPGSPKIKISPEVARMTRRRELEKLEWEIVPKDFGSAIKICFRRKRSADEAQEERRREACMEELEEGEIFD
ncbi:hypothetical protein QR680_011435 [Steinernema hermaphroditum]|uniref:Large ribosomal subunit protein eL29 n=1 Tax=Steinernema hermaphroditum TaxID=289476 RepID=A0AA39LY34_9BILA|nr:hypothetical protein QR680_011435 [Steinernema hermaphroditum]